VRHASHCLSRSAWIGALTQNVCEADWAVTARPIATRINAHAGREIPGLDVT
jgi:hypothetical protein